MFVCLFFNSAFKPISEEILTLFIRVYILLVLSYASKHTVTAVTENIFFVVCFSYTLPYTKSGVERSPWSAFRKPQFFHTFSVILMPSNDRKCTGKPRFSKIWSPTSLHSRFSVLFLWTRKLLFSTRKHQMYEFRKK